jgi:hypothetical protein
LLDGHIHSAGCKWRNTIAGWGARAGLSRFTNVAESVISCVTIFVTAGIAADIAAGVATSVTVGVTINIALGVTASVNEG